MANITPFIGLRYNNEKVNNLTAVVTPPYDIIDEKEQARYYAERPASIIRLELGLVFPMMMNLTTAIRGLTSTSNAGLRRNFFL